MRTIFIALIFILSGCSRNVEYIKAHANEKWSEVGYEIIGYEGFQWSIAGGDVWYQLINKRTPGLVYTGFLESYYGELQVYGPKVVNRFGIRDE